MKLFVWRQGSGTVGSRSRPPRPQPPSRARAWQNEAYPWNLYRTPSTINLDGIIKPHPKRTSAVFVVHGMGQPRWAQTASELRGGFEDALELTRRWQRENPPDDTRSSILPIELPPPYIWDGHWGDYPDVEKTFPDDWKRFNDPQRDFFRLVWQKRALSKRRTAVWYCKQQFRLLDPRVIAKVGVWAWLLYIPLQVVLPATVLFAFLRHPFILTQYLGDVRLYFDPQGIVEKAIVQNIDQRVGKQFLQLLGLDWEFRENAGIPASGERITFDRIVWVSHSLGTVVSYNVLSDLFVRAEALQRDGDEEQKRGVARFRCGLARFVTMGSPLDKAAFLFPRQSVKPWPNRRRGDLLETGETLEPGAGSTREWWINFYHVLDPVSGALSNHLTCGEQPPSNIHIGFWRWPGLAHLAYWSDPRTLRFILTRSYGRDLLRDKEYSAQPAGLLTFYAVFAYFLWAAVLSALVIGIYLWARHELKGFDWIIHR